MQPLNISEFDTTDDSLQRSLHNPNNADIDNSSEQQEADNDDVQEDPVSYWTRTGHWPEGHPMQLNSNFSYLLARPKSLSYHYETDSYNSDTPSEVIGSDELPREIKSAPYEDPDYKLFLETNGSFMEKSELDVTENSKEIYRNLLDAKQTFPENSLFRDGMFEKTCKYMQDRNEQRVIRDISTLIVPSAEILSFSGSGHLKILIEGINQGWNYSIPLREPRPQPDFSVGFTEEAFTTEQFDKLAPFVSNHRRVCRSYFMGTFEMFFPFLVCEVKCGPGALEIADRHNAHSMTLAVRAITELFRVVGRESEIHREILAFSFSYNHTTVRIYGHYPVIDGKETKYYRHPIHMYDFTALDGREKWTAYQFSKNIYDIWMPTHFKRLCTAIDQIPDGLFNVPQ